MDTSFISDTPSWNIEPVCDRCRFCLDNIPRIGIPEYIVPHGGGYKSVSKSDRKDRAVLQHWPDFNAFLRSAVEGCHICSLFLLQLSQEVRNRLQNYKSKEFPERGLITIEESKYKDAGLYEMTLIYPMPDDVQHLRGNNPSMTLHLKPTTG